MVNTTRICSLIAFAYFAVNSIVATELEPWFGNQLECDYRSSLLYQSYTHISSGSHEINKSSDDLFLTLSLENSPSPDYSFEIEGTVAKTRHKSNCLDNLRLTGRYLWLDDISGDPISLVTGLTLTKAFQGSLHDISSFHHGLFEGELNVSVGREVSCGEIWIHRWWAVGVIGMATRGSPWLRGDFEYDWRYNENNELKAFFHTLWGMGTHKLHVHDFNGYGDIHHQSVDMGLKYTYLIDFWGTASIEYAYRVYALNFPSKAHRVTLQLLF